MGRWGRWTLATLNVSIKRLGGTRRLLIAFPALCSSGAPNYSGSIRPENTAFRKKGRGEAQINTRANEDEGDKLTSTRRVWCTDAGPTHLLTVRGFAQHTERTCNHGDRRSLPPNPTVIKKKKKEKSSSLHKSFHSKTLKTLEYEGGEGKKAELEFFTSCFLLCKYGHSG